MTNCDMNEYWEQVYQWILSQKNTNPAPTGDLDWTRFPRTNFAVTQTLAASYEHDFTQAETDANIDGHVFVTVIDSDEGPPKDRGITVDKDIHVIVSVQCKCMPLDVTRQKECVNLLQATRDALRRFQFSHNGQPFKVYRHSYGEKDMAGMPVPWMGIRAANTFHAMFTTVYTNYLKPVLCG